MMSTHRWVQCVGILFSAFVCGIVSDAVGQDIRQTGQRRDLNWSPRRPDSGRVGDCYGNCGAGCSSRANLGCGGRQYWLKRIRSPLQTKRYTITECIANGNDRGRDEGSVYVQGEEYAGTITRYTARGTWIYVGFTARLCQEHDYFCRSRGGCLKASLTDHLRPIFRRIGGCSGTRRKHWSYNETFTAWSNARTLRPTGRTCTTTRS